MTNEIKEILRKDFEDIFVKEFIDIILELSFNNLLDYITNLQEENNNLQRQIKIMEKYFELIIDMGFDYDGYNKAENLKSLIDELVKLASLGREKNDTEPMYMSLDDEEKHYNILNEEIKGENKQNI